MRRVSFTAISKSDPTRTLETLRGLLSYLTASPSSGGCGWPSSAVHLFGFGQGGTAAVELAISWTRYQRSSSSGTSASGPKIQEIVDDEQIGAGGAKDETKKNEELGSIVSVCGPLLSVSMRALAVSPVPPFLIC